MGHLFLLRTQTHELKMRQMVEEISLGRLTMDQAMAKHNVLTRHTVRKWLDRVRLEDKRRTQAMNQAAKQPPPTIVEQMAHKADEFAGQVKQLQHELEQSQLWTCYI